MSDQNTIRSRIASPTSRGHSNSNRTEWPNQKPVHIRWEYHSLVVALASQPFAAAEQFAAAMAEDLDYVAMAVVVAAAAAMEEDLDSVVVAVAAAAMEEDFGFVAD